MGGDEHPMAVTDDEPAELTVGAVRELVERLERLERDREWLVKALREGDSASLTQLLSLLRTNGVTRYRRGDLEIELRPSRDGIERAAQEAGYLDEHGGPTDKLRESLHQQPEQRFGGGTNGTEDAMEDEPGPLPPLADLKQQSEELRRQQEADRSGVEVTEVDNG